MGTNINVFIEEKIGGYWRDRNLFALLVPAEANKGKDVYSLIGLFPGRSYSLFALMANVRNNFGITPISVPRGIPADASAIIKMQAGVNFGDVYHDPSWLSVEEIFDAIYEGGGYERMKILHGPSKHAQDALHSLLISIEEQLNRLGRVSCMMELYEKRKDFRIVFWFES